MSYLGFASNNRFAGTLTLLDIYDLRVVLSNILLVFEAKRGKKQCVEVVLQRICYVADYQLRIIDSKSQQSPLRLGCGQQSHQHG